MEKEFSVILFISLLLVITINIMAVDAESEVSSIVIENNGDFATDSIIYENNPLNNTGYDIWRSKR